MARILIIEDEIDMAQGLKDNFEFDGHEVSIASDGEKGLEMALTTSPQLIILDIMLPKISGFDVCKAIRHKGLATPIMMLTARGQEIDKILGLEFGADDYITKPFSVRELLARVKAVLRRYEDFSASIPAQFNQIGKLKVDFAQYRAMDEKGEVELSHKEFEILKFLLLHKGQTVSRDQLLNEIWGYEAFPATRTVDNFIVKLRKRIEDDPDHPRHIITVYGIGYKFVI